MFGWFIIGVLVLVVFGIIYAWLEENGIPQEIDKMLADGSWNPISMYRDVWTEWDTNMRPTFKFIFSVAGAALWFIIFAIGYLLSWRFIFILRHFKWIMYKKEKTDESN